MRLIVGIAGAIGSGKDSAAKALVSAYRFQRIGFSDALKAEVAHILRGTLLAYAEERSGLFDCDDETILQALLYEQRTPVTRRLLQEWGTELRRAEDPDYWVVRWRDTLHRLPWSARVVCPDVRFKNEVEAIALEGGFVVKIIRPDAAETGHTSETALSDFQGWHAVFHNTGTVADLEDVVLAWTRLHVLPEQSP